MNNEELIKKYWNYNKFGNLDDALGDGLRELMDKARLDEREKIKQQMEIDGIAIGNWSWKEWDNWWKEIAQRHEL